MDSAKLKELVAPQKRIDILKNFIEMASIGLGAKPSPGVEEAQKELLDLELRCREIDAADSGLVGYPVLYPVPVYPVYPVYPPAPLWWPYTITWESGLPTIPYSPSTSTSGSATF